MKVIKLDLSDIATLEELKQKKNKIFGPDGPVSRLYNELKNAPHDQKAIFGKRASTFKKQAEKTFAQKIIDLNNQSIQDRIDHEWADPHLPLKRSVGYHPLTLIKKRFRTWFLQNSYYEVQGSEIENGVYNFQRLNIPEDHPAREMQDSMYINSNKLLRTHNTGFTARELEKNANQAFSCFVIGKVYRIDEDDLTHYHQFTQVDFVSVGDVNFPNLIWTLNSLLTYVFEEKVKVRLRPSFFPFTEPSVEVDVFYKGKWVEVLGSGMMHEEVMKMAGYTNDMNAFASGIGIERIAMIKYEINNIREFYKNDLRFLKQFH